MDAKKCKDGSWVVEVRKVDEEDGGWMLVSEGLDGETACAVADALHNFMGCGIAGEGLGARTEIRMTMFMDDGHEQGRA